MNTLLFILATPTGPEIWEIVKSLVLLFLILGVLIWLLSW